MMIKTFVRSMVASNAQLNSCNDELRYINIFRSSPQLNWDKNGLCSMMKKKCLSICLSSVLQETI